jgi:hypothetical protein
MNPSDKLVSIYTMSFIINIHLIFLINIQIFDTPELKFSPEDFERPSHPTVGPPL